MVAYLLRRLVQLVPTLAGVSLVVFLVLRLTPGDPAMLLAGTEATATDVERIRRELGLADPIHVQYGRFLVSIATGDLGRSYRTRRPVLTEISGRLPATLQLAVAGLAIALLLGLGIGIISGVRPYSPLDNGSMLLALLGVSLPSFWLGLMLMWLFSVRLGWLPTTGAGTWRHLILPAVTIGLPATAIIARMTRSSLLETLRQDYVRTAYAKGLRERTVVLGHALRNGLIPTITVVGLQFGGLLAGAVVVETVFAWPGIGRLLVDSIANRDYTVVQATVLLFAVIFLVVNLLIDLAYAWVDPRIRYA